MAKGPLWGPKAEKLKAKQWGFSSEKKANFLPMNQAHRSAPNAAPEI
jgi:hypothetical protein